MRAPKSSKTSKHSSLNLIAMFQKPFSFEGRIRRTEYAFTFIAMVFFRILMEVMVFQENVALIVIMLLVLFPFMWFHFAQGAKRCHDIGKSGWWQIIPFYFFVLLFRDGDQGLNEYGTNPKEEESGEKGFSV